MGAPAGDRDERPTDIRVRRATERLAASGHRSRIPRDAVPPGPRWPALVQTIALSRLRHRLLPYLHRRFGTVVTARLIPGDQPLVFFSRPEEIRQIFAGDPEIFDAGEANGILGPLLGEHSIILLDSVEHARARRLILPAFNRRALRGYAALVSDVAAAQLQSWVPGRAFRSLEAMSDLTLEVILRVVYGMADGARTDALRPVIRAVVNVNPMVLIGWAYPALHRLPPWRRAIEDMAGLDELIFAEIAERHRAADLTARTDVLSRLLLSGTEAEDAGQVGSDDPPLSDAEVRDQLVTLLLAGHETTATALAWTLHEVGQSPELQRRSQWAADHGDDDWLEALLKESMRLHPVISAVRRTLRTPARVGDWELPAGTIVAPSIIEAHQAAGVYPDPERYRPERFLDGGPPAYTWIPFGGGVRRCVGAGFSLMEGVAVLREIFTRWDIVSAGSDHPRVRNVTSVPGHGARIVVTPR